MSNVVIKVENISKVYDLRQVGTGTLSQDLNRVWAKFRGKPDPYAKLAEINDRTVKSNTGLVKALNDISFEVEKGEVVGIIGENGAGKSTLLKILSKITAPSKGSLKYKGRLAALLEVGTGMHSEMTARENIYLNGAIMGMNRFEINRKFDAIVDFAGIAKYIDTPIKRFSSGMRVRLGFAVAAFLEPEILIIDEVLAVGDMDFQQKCIGKIEDISKGAGRTILFVSHNMNSVRNLCTRSIVLEKGEVKAIGPTPSMIDIYLQSAANTLELDCRENPIGDSIAKISHAKIINKNGDLNITPYIHEPIGVQIDFSILDSSANVFPQIHVHCNGDQKVFVSRDDSLEISPLDTGHYRSTMWIPDNLLNRNEYTLWVSLVSTNFGIKRHAFDSSMGFKALEDLSKIKGRRQRKMPGIIKPNISWDLNNAR